MCLSHTLFRHLLACPSTCAYHAIPAVSDVPIPRVYSTRYPCCLTCAPILCLTHMLPPSSPDMYPCRLTMCLHPYLCRMLSPSPKVPLSCVYPTFYPRPHLMCHFPFPTYMLSPPSPNAPLFVSTLHLNLTIHRCVSACIALCVIHAIPWRALSTVYFTLMRLQRCLIRVYLTLVCLPSFAVPLSAVNSTHYPYLLPRRLFHLSTYSVSCHLRTRFFPVSAPHSSEVS
jgi:hypothetical protein